MFKEFPKQFATAKLIEALVVYWLHPTVFHMMSALYFAAGACILNHHGILAAEVGHANGLDVVLVVLNVHESEVVEMAGHLFLLAVSADE